MQSIKIIGEDPLAERLRRLLSSDHPAEIPDPPNAPAVEPFAAAIITDASTFSRADLSALLQSAQPVLCHISSLVALDLLRQWRKIIPESNSSLYFAWPLRFASAVCRLKDLLRDQTILAVSSLSAGPSEILDQQTLFDQLPTLGSHRISEFRIQNSEIFTTQPPFPASLVHALDLLRCIVGDFTHVTALGTAKTQSDLLAARPSALVTSLHAADRTLAQHVQVQSVQPGANVDVLTTTARYRLDWLHSTLTIQDAAGEKIETFSDDAWPALLRVFLDWSVREPDPTPESDSVSPPTGIAKPGPRTQPAGPDRRTRHPVNLSDFADSFPTFALAWAVASALTNGQLTAVPLR